SCPRDSARPQGVGRPSLSRTEHILPREVLSLMYTSPWYSKTSPPSNSKGHLYEASSLSLTFIPSSFNPPAVESNHAMAPAQARYGLLERLPCRDSVRSGV